MIRLFGDEKSSYVLITAKMPQGMSVEDGRIGSAYIYMQGRKNKYKEIIHMKKSVFLMTMLLLLMILSGCSSEGQGGVSDGIFDDNSDTGSSFSGSYGNIAGDYIYRGVNTADGYLILKYSLKTGEVDTVCQDPFCTHLDSSCLFYLDHGSKVSYIGNTVYFEMTDDSDKSTILSYDAESMCVETVFLTEGRIGTIFSYDYDLFFDVISNTETGTSNEYVRFDTESGTTTKITAESNASIYTIKNERIIWKKGSSYYSTDLDGKNKEVMDRSTEVFGYVYSTTVTTEGKITMHNLTHDLYRQKKGSDEKTLIASNIWAYTVYRDKIIYLVALPEEEQQVINSNAYAKDYDIFGGNVYIMDLDGSNARLLCHAESCYILGAEGFVENEWCSGDWLGLRLCPTEEDTETGASYYTDMLFVNTVTGEYVVCRY